MQKKTNPKWITETSFNWSQILSQILTQIHVNWTAETSINIFAIATKIISEQIGLDSQFYPLNLKTTEKNKKLDNWLKILQLQDAYNCWLWRLCLQ